MITVIAIVHILAYWYYSHQEPCVRWHNTLSKWFTVGNGTRQGGVLYRLFCFLGIFVTCCLLWLILILGAMWMAFYNVLTSCFLHRHELLNVFSVYIDEIDMTHSSAATLFKKMKHGSHCLNPILPPAKDIEYNLRNNNNTYVLPQCKYNLYKQSFVNWCLFDAWCVFYSMSQLLFHCILCYCLLWFFLFLLCSVPCTFVACF